MPVVSQPFCRGSLGEAEIYLLLCFYRGLKVRITHCDVFAGFRKGVCARTGAEVAVKQQQLSSGVKGDRNQDSHVLFLKMTPCLVWGEH